MGNVAEEYTERLRELGHDVQVFTPHYRTVQEDPDFVHRLAAPIQSGNAAFVPSLFRHLKNFDLTHLHYPFFGSAEPVALFHAMHPKQPLVMTYHMDAVAIGMKGAFFSAHQKLLFPWIVKRADRVLVSSLDYAETSALAQVPGIFRRVEVHPFGVDMDRFFPGSEPELRRTFGIPDSHPVLIFVGGLDPAHHFKGLPILIEALAQIQDLPWHVVVVGSGSLRASFEAQVQDEGFGSRMHFVGGVSHEDLPKFYRMADIHVFPSTERAEAFGIVAVEAAASGLPTIASNLPGVRTVVADGKTGLHVPPRNAPELARALRQLIQDTNLRAELGRQARRRSEQEFAWKPLIKKLEQTYIDVTRGTRSDV